MVIIRQVTKTTLALLCSAYCLGCTGIRTTTIPCKNAVGISDTLNRVDEHNKKTGYWVEYLNSRMKPAPCKDARYALLAYYWKGKRILPVGRPSKPFSGSPNIMIDRTALTETIAADSIYLLNGDVTLEYRTSTIELIYDHGLLLFERNTPVQGSSWETVDYSSHYVENPYSCRLFALHEGAYYTAYIGIIDGQFKWIRIK